MTESEMKQLLNSIEQTDREKMIEESFLKDRHSVSQEDFAYYHSQTMNRNKILDEICKNFLNND